ncbi:MAG TPA: hypothetical protein VFP68_05200 [Burkholderiaceae bacterium]|nr:hypothetical protein [Burkholderiaceae bacterium]
MNEIARTWGLPYPMAERLLKGELPVRLETNGAIAVFMNAQELLECHQARVALGDGPCQTLYDPEYWKCPIYGEDRRRRIGNVLHFHARDENSRRSGFVGGEAQLTELLRDLRVWGDAYRVDLLGCLSRAFDWAV